MVNIISAYLHVEFYEPIYSFSSQVRAHRISLYENTIYIRVLVIKISTLQISKDMQMRQLIFFSSALMEQM